MARRSHRSLLVLLLVALASLAGVAPDARAATIFVDEPGSAVTNGGCTLGDAIQSANNDAQVGNCQAVYVAGDPDTIVLTTDVTLDTAFSVGNGLPQITSVITIEGSGHTVRRDPSFTCGTAADPEFRIFDVANGGDLTLNDTTVRNGCVESSVSARGGGIRVRATGGGSAVLSLNRSTVRNNEAYGAASGDENNGGGLAVQGDNGSTAAAHITRSAFRNNTTDGFGGAIDASIDPSIATSEVVIEKSTFAQNSAGVQGGAINAEGNVFIASSTFAENSAPAGQGRALRAQQTVFVGNITIKNSIIHNGNGADCVADDNSAIVSQGWNLASDNSCSLTHPTDRPGRTAAQVGLLALSDNGVPGNAHYGLTPASQAIDSGDPNADASSGPTDQIGQPRSGQPERGSIEFIEPNIVTTPKSALNLGRVRINKNGACKQVEIRNDGNADLDISAIAIVNDPPAWFRLCAVPSTPTTLAAGEHTFIYARCHPTTSAASRTGTLRISSNDPQTPNKDITMKCTLAP